MHRLHKELQTDIKFLLYCLVIYYNQHCAGAPTLKKRNKVYLLWKNIETTRSSDKLNHIKIRPFKIIRDIKEISFKLKLSEKMWQKYSVFNVFLLEPALKQVSVLTKILKIYLIKQEEQYEVEWILQHKDINHQ